MYKHLLNMTWIKVQVNYFKQGLIMTWGTLGLR